MNSDHVRFGKKQRNAREWDVGEVDVEIANEPGQRQMVFALQVGCGMRDEAELGNQILKQALLIRGADENEFVRGFDLPKSAQQVADVRADAEVLNTTDINGYAQLTHSNRFQLPLIEREALGKNFDAATDGIGGFGRIDVL